MLKRLTSLLVLLAVVAGVASAAPLHTGGSECAMGGAGMMDCCESARSADASPGAQAARLCCAVNCQGDGSSGAAPAAKVSAPQTAPSHPSVTQPPLGPPVGASRRGVLPPLKTDSPPTYLLNLAFLI